MKKKIVSMFLSAAMVMTVLAGCGNSNTPAASTQSAASSAETKVEDSTPAEASSSEAQESGDADYSGVNLTFWSMWGSSEPQGQVLSEAAAAFEEKTGAKINIEWKGRDVKTIIATALEAKDDVDIFEEDYSRIGKTYAQYCYDLTDMAAAAGYDAQSFGCFAEESIKWSGFLCSIAEQPQVGGIFYNKDIFADCGITELPATWEEFMAACQIMVDKGYQPMALDSTYADFNFGYHLDRVIGQEETEKLAENGGWSDNAGAVKAAQDIIDFVNAGYMADGAPDEYPSSQNKIGLTGKVAMIVCANYVCAEVNNTTQAEINWGMFNYPTVEGGSNSTNAYAGANSLAIAAHTENPQAAFDFIMFLTSGEFDQKMADAASQIPADPGNTAPAIMDGTVETLNATESPLAWSMGLNANSDLGPAFKDVITQLYDGKFKTGEEFTAAMDALY